MSQTSTMTDTLSSCPFCGGEAEFQAPKSRIVCKSCTASISADIHPGIYRTWDGLEEAEKSKAYCLWNSRAAPRPVQHAVPTFEEILKDVPHSTIVDLGHKQVVHSFSEEDRRLIALERRTKLTALADSTGTPAPTPLSVGAHRVGARLLNGYLNAVAMLGYGDKSSVIELVADARQAFGPDATPAAERQAPVELSVGTDPSLQAVLDEVGEPTKLPELAETFGAASIPPHVRNFLGKVQGVCLGVAMSGDDHPSPDEALMEIYREAQAILFPETSE